MPPRNKRLYEQGQALRAFIRATLETHPPTAKPLTAKHLLRRLDAANIRASRPSESVIWYHLRAIRDGSGPRDDEDFSDEEHDLDAAIG